MSTSGIDLLGVIYLRFPQTHKTIHGEFGTPRTDNMCCRHCLASLIVINVFEIYIFFVCHFVSDIGLLLFGVRT